MDLAETAGEPEKEVKMYAIEKITEGGERSIVKQGLLTEEGAERIAARFSLADNSGAVYVVKKD